MKVLSCSLLVLTLAQGVVFGQRDLNMPQRLNLVAYFPLDRQNGLTDVINNRVPMVQSSTKLLTERKGPFGQYGTAYTVDDSAVSPLITYDAYSWQPEFTLTFFVSTKALSHGGLLSLGREAGFNVLYDSPGTLIFHSRKSYFIGQLSFTPSEAGNEWQFFAITFAKNTFTVYDRSGDILLTVPTTLVAFGGSSFYFDLGSAFDQRDRWYMNSYSGDALSCVMWFKTALTSSEVAELPHICKKNARAIVWPQPHQLYGYWPMKDESLVDLGMQQHHGAANPDVFYQKAIGPYGKYDTALQIKSHGHFLEYKSPLKAIPSTNSFSILLHFAKDSNAEEGCLFEFLDKFGTEKAFQICYTKSSFIEVFANGVSIDSYNMVQQKGAWTFMGFVFDGIALTVYSKHGILSRATPQPHILASNSFNNNGIRLGRSLKMNATLSPGDSLACLMVYETALTADEVRHAQKSCRVVLGSPPCGSAKLPLAKAYSYSSSDVTTVPQPGQFPWIASLRYDGNHICSASIIDQNWVLTSAQCFVGRKNGTSNYTVVIGQHDLAIETANQEIYSIEKVVMQQKSGIPDGEYALLALIEPINFNSDFVNDACFVAGDIKGDLKNDARLFVHGWGLNGRNALTETTLPRYFSGAIMTDKQCGRAWGQDVYVGKKNNYCFFSLTTDKDVPCDGDIGAPLMGQASENAEFGYGERFVELGMFYKRDGNCTITKPGLFVGLDKPAFNWITEKIACAVPGIVHPSSCPQI